MKTPDFEGARVDLSVGEIRALRSFAVADDGALLPVTQEDRGEPWVAGENTATCVLTNTLHRAPEETCRCGFYAYGVPTWVDRDAYGWFEHVTAVVEFYGKVIAGEKGLRAEKARIVALWTSGAVPLDLRERIQRTYPDVEMFTEVSAMLERYPLTALETYVPPTHVDRLANGILRWVTNPVGTILGRIRRGTFRPVPRVAPLQRLVGDGLGDLTPRGEPYPFLGQVVSEFVGSRRGDVVVVAQAAHVPLDREEVERVATRLVAAVAGHVKALVFVDNTPLVRARVVDCTPLGFDISAPLPVKDVFTALQVPGGTWVPSDLRGPLFLDADGPSAETAMSEGLVDLRDVAPHVPLAVPGVGPAAQTALLDAKARTEHRTYERIMQEVERAGVSTPILPRLPEQGLPLVRPDEVAEGWRELMWYQGLHARALGRAYLSFSDSLPDSARLRVIGSGAEELRVPEVFMPGWMTPRGWTVSTAPRVAHIVAFGELHLGDMRANIYEAPGRVGLVLENEIVMLAWRLPAGAQED